MIYLCSGANEANTKGKNWFLHTANLSLKNLFINKTLAQLTKQIKCPKPPAEFSPVHRKVLMEYCRKFCRKAHANKQADTSKNILSLPTLIHIHTHVSWENRQTKTFKGEIQHQKMGIKSGSFYYFMLLLQFADCLSNGWRGGGGWKRGVQLQYFPPRPKKPEEMKFGANTHVHRVCWKSVEKSKLHLSRSENGNGQKVCNRQSWHIYVYVYSDGHKR